MTSAKSYATEQRLNSLISGQITVYNSVGSIGSSDLTILTTPIGIGAYDFRVACRYFVAASGGIPSFGISIPAFTTADAQIVFFPNGVSTPQAGEMQIGTADSSGPAIGNTANNVLLIEGYCLTTAAGSISLVGHVSSSTMTVSGKLRLIAL